jgi:transposase
LALTIWAWRKGHRYGTILCDLEQGTVVDLLRDRTADSVAEWLRTHPGIEIVSRDRARAYAEAARRALPSAVQVADHWHLMHNISEALQRCLEHEHKLLGQAAKAISASPAQVELLPADATQAEQTPARLEQMQRATRSRRLARYESVMELARQGIPIKRIARTLDVDRRTVRRWMRSDGFPERVRVHRRSSLDHFGSYLERRFEEGCHNGTRLWQELREQGYRGGASMVRRWIRHLRPKRNRHAPPPTKSTQSTITGSPRQTAWLLLQQPMEAQAFLNELSQRSPEIEACGKVAREFVRMIRERDSKAWHPWLQSDKTTALARFAQHLCRDEAAVLSALRLPWSNGKVEGQVHRLKLIKRQMYGRAKFDLLRLRVLPAA